MINDFSEIRDEKDRAIYAQCREILDTWFLTSIRKHEDKAHHLNECWAEEQEDLALGLLESLLILKLTENQDYKSTLDNGVFTCYREMVSVFQRLIVLQDVRNQIVKDKETEH